MAKSQQQAPARPKPKCPITPDQFNAKAIPVAVVMSNKHTMMAMPRQFATGSLGWYCNGKIPLEVDGITCMVQVGIAMTLIGSKPEKESK